MRASARQGAEWAPRGASTETQLPLVLEPQTKTHLAGFSRLRGKDSNLDYLIQRPLPPVFARAVAYRDVASDEGSQRIGPASVLLRDAASCRVGFQEGFSAIHSHQSSFDGEADR
jgi:hypothetical protein